MELLLNILWLMLALPAIWVWRRDSDFARHHRSFAGSRCFLILACVLLLLFPVISATDDLHAMRSEIEESNPSKRAVRQSAADKSASVALHSVGPLALLTSAAELIFAPQVGAQPTATSLFMPAPVFFSASGSRAPPVSRLG